MTPPRVAAFWGAAGASLLLVTAFLGSALQERRITEATAPAGGAPEAWDCGDNVFFECPGGTEGCRRSLCGLLYVPCPGASARACNPLSTSCSGKEQPEICEFEGYREIKKCGGPNNYITVEHGGAVDGVSAACSLKQKNCGDKGWRACQDADCQRDPCSNRTFERVIRCVTKDVAGSPTGLFSVACSDDVAGERGYVCENEAWGAPEGLFNKSYCLLPSVAAATAISAGEREADAPPVREHAISSDNSDHPAGGCFVS